MSRQHGPCETTLRLSFVLMEFLFPILFSFFFSCPETCLHQIFSSCMIDCYPLGNHGTSHQKGKRKISSTQKCRLGKGISYFPGG